jgi:hypothetical protein
MFRVPGFRRPASAAIARRSADRGRRAARWREDRAAGRGSSKRLLAPPGRTRSWSPEVSTSGTCGRAPWRGACSAGSQKAVGEGVPGPPRGRGRARGQQAHGGFDRPGPRSRAVSTNRRGSLLGGRLLRHPLVDALVAAAEQDQVLQAASRRQRWSNCRRAGRAGPRPLRRLTPAKWASWTRKKGSAFMTMPGPPRRASRRRSGACRRVVAEVVDVRSTHPASRGPLHDPVPRGPDHAREDREHVNAHIRPGSGCATPSSCLEVDLATNEETRGMRVSPERLDHEDVGARAGLQDVRHRPSRGRTRLRPVGRAARGGSTSPEAGREVSSGMRRSIPRNRSASSIESTPASFSTNRPCGASARVPRRPARCAGRRGEDPG